MPRMTIADAIADKVRELEEENDEIRKALDERTLSTNKRLRERVKELEEGRASGLEERSRLKAEVRDLKAGTPLLDRDKLIKELRERVSGLETINRGLQQNLQRSRERVRDLERELRRISREETTRVVSLEREHRHSRLKAEVRDLKVGTDARHCRHHAFLDRDKLIRELKERIRSLERTEKWVLGANRELERENKLVRSRNRALDDRVKEMLGRHPCIEHSRESHHLREYVVPELRTRVHSLEQYEKLAQDAYEAWSEGLSVDEQAGVGYFGIPDEIRKLRKVVALARDVAQPKTKSSISLDEMLARIDNLENALRELDEGIGDGT